MSDDQKEPETSSSQNPGLSNVCLTDLLGDSSIVLTGATAISANEVENLLKTARFFVGNDDGSRTYFKQESNQ